MTVSHTHKHTQPFAFLTPPFHVDVGSSGDLLKFQFSLSPFLDRDMQMQRNAMYSRDSMHYYRTKKDQSRRSVLSKYSILGFISSGTYGRVYKAQSKDDEGRLYAIKKFKPDKEGEIITYTGISQSAIREIAVCVFLVVLFFFFGRYFDNLILIFNFFFFTYVSGSGSDNELRLVKS